MTEIIHIIGLFLVAAVIIVPIASRLKLGSVLGYIIGGMLISPLLPSLHVDVTTLQHFAEFGVVMMLFLVGLELEPKTLWRMRGKLLGLGGLQVGLTIVAVTGIASQFDLPFGTSLAIGFVFALSSTAIVLQTLNEQGLMKSEGGQSCFSVLLFQDIAVIPMLAVIPLLAVGAPDLASSAAESAGHGGGLSLVAGLVGWQQGLVTILAVTAVVLVGVLLSRPIFRFAASANLREILVATALLWVVGIALLMHLVELSPALGTFLAGVVLANSEYRHELESNIAPFKGLLLGLFFMTVGANIDFGLLADQLGLVIALTLGLMVLKGLILFAIAVIFKVRGPDRVLFSLGLAQGGEFAFVLLAFTVANHVMQKELADLMLLVVALSMLLTPAAFILRNRIVQFYEKREPEREPDEIDEQTPIIIAGHGRFGGVVNRMLRGLGYETTVLDYSYGQLEILRKFGLRAHFGDATRPDLLHAAGIEKARLLVVAIDGREAINELVKYVVHNYPKVHVIARAVDRHHVYELYSLGCRDIVRETFDSSIRMGRSALEALGIHPFEAEKKSRQFVHVDTKMMIELAPLYRIDEDLSENLEYVKKAQEVRDRNEATLRGADRSYGNSPDRGWVPPTLRDVLASKEKEEELGVP